MSEKKEVKIHKVSITVLFKKIKENMENIGTYRPEFDNIIMRYAEMKKQYDILFELWCKDGCNVLEEYTNKSGFTNTRKTILYQSLETLRKDLLELENTLGLTPKGLKTVKPKGLDKKNKSVLENILGS